MNPWADTDELESQREALDATERRLRSLIRRSSHTPRRGGRDRLRQEVVETAQQRRRLDEAVMRSVPMRMGR